MISVRSATSLFLRRHFEEKIQAEEKENDIRRPACQKRWKLANPAHGFQKLGHRPINDPKSHSESHASHRAARPHQKRERNCQEHAYRREQRERNFLLPLHPESRDVKARPLQAINVVPKLPPAHLERLPDLPVEVTGGLGEFWQRGDRRKPLISANLPILKIAHPTPFHNPTLFPLR